MENIHERWLGNEWLVGLRAGYQLHNDTLASGRETTDEGAPRSIRHELSAPAE